MSITKNDARQEVQSALVSFTYADFVSGTLAPAVDLPYGAIITGGFIVIDTAFDSATSDTIIVGDSVDGDRYAAAVDGQAAALTALTPTGYKYTAIDEMGITLTSVGTPTAGAGRLCVEYIIDGRATHTQD